MTTTPQSAEAQEREALLDAMKDMLNGWKYIRSSHGDLYGVGWDRAQEKMENAIASIEARASLPSAAASGEAPTVKDSLHVAPTPAVEGLTADVERAKKTIARLCDKGLLSMSIPVRPDDEDMVLMRIISAALAASPVPMASSAGEPVTLQSVELTRDTSGMCVVKINGREAIRDNGDVIGHYATLDWFAPPAASLREQEEPDAVAVMYPLPNGRWDVKIVEWSERPKTGTGYQLGQRYRVIDAKRLGREKEQDHG